MTETVCIPFRKVFNGTSENGLTFNWLKVSYGRSFEGAIADAVWIVYYPLMLASAPETWCKVVPAVVRARERFQSLMKLASGSPSVGDSVPERIKVLCRNGFDLASERGRTFQWLVHTYGENAVDEILYAVWLVYFPAALASSPKTIANASLHAERCSLVFEQKMFHAISESNPDEMAVIANRLDKTFRSSPTEDPVKDVPFSTAPEAPDAKVPETDDVVNEAEDDDDELDLDNEVF
jgi:hypothetical protein